MQDRAVTQPEGRRNRMLATAALQIVIAVVASLWAVRFRNDAAMEEAPLGPGFWGLVALAVFCGMLAVVNLLFPLLRFSYPAPRPERQRLAHSLESISNSAEVARELFGLGLAFFAPALPLAFMTWRLNVIRSDFLLLGVGSLLISIVLGGLLILVTGRQLYTRLVGGDASADLDTLPLHPGDTARFAVSYVPDRLEPTRLEVRMLCVETGHKFIQPKDERVLGSRTSTKHDAYKVTLHTETFEQSPTAWEYDGQLSIPDDALISDTSDPRFMVDWYLEVEVAFDRAPDVTFVFPFTVKDL